MAVVSKYSLFNGHVQVIPGGSRYEPASRVPYGSIPKQTAMSRIRGNPQKPMRCNLAVCDGLLKANSPS